MRARNPFPIGCKVEVLGIADDEVQTEVAALNMTGSSSLGPVNMHLHPSILTFGEMEETTNITMGVLDVPPFAEGGAYSIISFYFEIEIGG